MIIRAAGDGLKDEDDDHAFQKLIGDVQRIRQELTTTETSVATAATTLGSVPTQTFLGRTTAGTGAVENLTATQATAILSPMVASGISHAKGLVPDPPASSGTAKFLREDATWAAPTATAPTGTFNKISGGAQTVASATSNVTITTWSAVGTATLSGMDTSTGIFTVPSDGLYLVTVYLWPTFPFVVATQLWSVYVDRNNASSSDASFGVAAPASFNSAADNPRGSTSGARLLTAGDTLRARVSNQGASTLTVAEAHFNIMKLA